MSSDATLSEKDKQTSRNGQKKETEHKKQGRPAKVDNFDLDVIRRQVVQKLNKGEVLNVYTLRAQLVAFDINVSATTLRMSLKTLGFEYDRHDNSKANGTLCERSDIITWRRQYLRQLQAFKAQGRPIIYLDETWVNAGHAPTKEWQSDQHKRKKKIEPGRGGRWIVVDAGGKDGFIEGASLIFRANSSSGDYHAEMDGPRFETWFKEQLLPGLPPRGVVVIDNAPYHTVLTDECRCPTSSSRKEEMKAWLTEKGCVTTEDMLKPELAQLVKQNRPSKKYRVDVLAEEAGHTVLRLPPYHCDLNPIEMVWAVEKGHVARNNTSQSMEDVHRLFLEGREKVVAVNMWPSFVSHVEKVEKRYWDMDGLRDGLTVPQVHIQMDCDTDEEDPLVLPPAPLPVADRCPECGKSEDGAEEEVWFGCDGCELWWHQNCLDELAHARINTSLRDASQPWLCETCLVQRLQAGDTTVLPVILNEL